MYVQVEKSKDNKSRAVANSFIDKKSGVKQKSLFEDNRKQATHNKSLQLMLGNSTNVVQRVTQLPSSNKYVRDGLQPATRLAIDTWALTSGTGSVKFNYEISMEEHNPDEVLLGDLSITIRIDLAALRRGAAAHGGVGVPHAHVEYVDRTQYFIITRSSPRACEELTDAEALDVINNNVLANRLKDWICQNLVNMPGLQNIDRTWLDDA